MMNSQANKIYWLALLKKIRRERARNNIEFFVGYYLPHLADNKTPEFHGDIHRLLKTEKRLGIAAPRGFAKSTTVQIIYGLHCLLFNQGEDILSISASAQMAEEWIRKIKFELEGNERIKEDFGGILAWGEKESKKWTSDHIVIHKGMAFYSQMRARGRGCQVRGLRPTKVFCDDLEDEQLTRSEEQRRLLREWFLGALLNVLRINQQLVVIGTILHPLALLANIIEKKDEFKEWQTRKYQALQEDGTSLWEDRFPATDLLRKKFEIGTYAFQAEFQNNPITADICIFQQDWLKKYDEVLNIKEKFVGIDPAASLKDSADYTGIVVWGVAENGKIYELESLKGRWGIWDFSEKVIDIYLRHKPLRIGIEEVAFQQILKPVFIKEARKKGILLPIQGIPLGRYKAGQKRASRDKFARAMTVIHLFEQDLIRLKPQGLIDQLLFFPTGSEDDLVDAAVHGLHLILRYSEKGKVFQAKQSDLPPPSSAAQTFTIKDNKMPALVNPEEFFQKGKDWRIG